MEQEQGTNEVANNVETQEEKEVATTYANGKYSTVSELEKAYEELQSSYSSKLGAFEGAPEEYEIPESIEDENDPTFNFVKEWGKDNQLSGKGLESLINGYTEHMQKVEEQYRANQLEQLGENAEKRIQNVSDWIKANIGDEYLESLNASFAGAKGIEAIEKMISLSSNSKVAETKSTPHMDKEKIRQLRFAKDDNGNRRMSVDPAYRQMVIEQERKLAGL